MIPHHTGKQKPGKAFQKYGLFLIILMVFSGCQTMTPPPQKQPPTREILTPKSQPKTYHIGVLLPLSGQNSAIGDDLWKGAEMALLNSDKENVILHLKDTKGTESGTIHALKEWGSTPLDAIVGPLFAPEVRMLSHHAPSKAVPVLALSSDTSLARKGMFILGLSPQEQLRHVLTFAKTKGRARLAAILPQGKFGDSLKAVLTKAAENGWDGVSILSYDSERGLLTEQIDTLKNNDFDTLVLPVGGTELKGILTSLKDESISLDGIFVLGTGAWDDENLPKDLLPATAYYAAPDPSDREPFEFSFEKTYGHKPKRMATLTYDAITVLTRAIPDQEKKESLFNQMTNPAGFDGADGHIRLNQDGSIKRTLVIMTAAGDIFSDTKSK